MTEHLRRQSVEQCPHCGHRHDYAVMIESGEAGTLVFGGGSTLVEVGLKCPETGQIFSTSIALANNERFLRIVESSLGESGPRPEPTHSDPDFAAWVSASRASALDFAKAMLTASSAAIPVYFAVLKYLGMERLGNSDIGRFSMLPPILFLVALASFAVSLRPELSRVTPESFANFRERRLRQINVWITAGLVGFVAAAISAVVLFSTNMLP